ncbi:hypothetical protein RBA41_07075 [Massilia sp. CCM 9210]|uniref:hypothetical protein n=1 Tax=Massilia scottii TaxID=3057166 RepID=UPI0027969D36|nr:hypothetical protein [Massilia sp. CCM 9210]MDQ1813065.1 hypothetical protein [Massilia sp. CCM 9210]
MNPGIKFVRLEPNSQEFELHVTVATELASFTTQMYVSNAIISRLGDGLENLIERRSVFDFEIGRFGPEYAGGALRLRFNGIGSRYYITANVQSSYADFGKYLVASDANLYFETELMSIDQFIVELRAFSNMHCDEANLMR